MQLKRISNIRSGIIENNKDFSSILFLIEILPGNGVSHLIEHLIAKDLLPLVEQYGFNFRAESGMGYTLFQVSGIKSIPKELLIKVYNQIFNKEFIESELKSEKNVAIEEIKKNLENLQDFIGERIYKLTTGSSVLGDIQTIDSLTLNQIKDFYKEYYVMGNTIITTNQKGCLEQEYTKLIKDGKKEIDITFADVDFSERKDNLGRAHFLAVFNFLGNNYDKKILAGIFHSRIFNELCKKAGKVYDISCWTDICTGLFSFDFSSDIKTFDENKMRLFIMFKKFISEQITDQEFIQAKEKILSEIKFSWKDIRNKIYDFAFFIKWKQTDIFLHAFEYLDKISLSRIKEVINNLRASKGAFLVLK